MTNLFSTNPVQATMLVLSVLIALVLFIRSYVSYRREQAFFRTFRDERVNFTKEDWEKLDAEFLKGD